MGGYALIADSIAFPDRRFAGQSGIDSATEPSQAIVARSLRQHDYVPVFQSGAGGSGHVDYKDRAFAQRHTVGECHGARFFYAARVNYNSEVGSHHEISQLCGVALPKRER